MNNLIGCEIFTNQSAFVIIDQQKSDSTFSDGEIDFSIDTNTLIGLLSPLTLLVNTNMYKKIKLKKEDVDVDVYKLWAKDASVHQLSEESYQLLQGISAQLSNPHSKETIEILKRFRSMVDMEASMKLTNQQIATSQHSNFNVVSIESAFDESMRMFDVT